MTPKDFSKLTESRPDLVNGFGRFVIDKCERFDIGVDADRLDAILDGCAHDEDKLIHDLAQELAEEPRTIREWWTEYSREYRRAVRQTVRATPRNVPQ